ncbi:hypothetical protein [Sulfuriroseicoccus oceanibius]|uniref:Uncharacterized protein n=1 Tax=Sulfuriroseicoccus oceanibius TaxID=2707525 RepID=A0A6B3L3P6_9BACT|nr:hypothetical protein [Sulfuriroseicoccus oceanibius]QQL43998.1 hypothetical protein G3M56_008830 [Sulfuriroseicoccus oceanibius]
MSENSSDNGAKPVKAGWLMKFLVGGLPFGLFIGVVVATLLYVRNEGTEGTATGEVTGVGYTRDMTVSSLQDRYEKFEYRVGRRNFQDADGIDGVANAAALVRGSLSRTNMGFSKVDRLDKMRGEREFSAFWVDVVGMRNPSEIIEIRVPYDQPVDERSDVRISSLSLAVALEVANAVTGTENRRTIRFAFVPDGFDGGPVAVAYDAIYQNRQLRVIAGFEVEKRDDLNPTTLSLADGSLDWSAVLEVAKALKADVLDAANR